MDAHQFEQNDIAGETFFQSRLGHGVAAVFDDDDGAGKRRIYGRASAKMRALSAAEMGWDSLIIVSHY